MFVHGTKPPGDVCFVDEQEFRYKPFVGLLSENDSVVSRRTATVTLGRHSIREQKNLGREGREINHNGELFGTLQIRHISDEVHWTGTNTRGKNSEAVIPIYII